MATFTKNCPQQIPITFKNDNLTVSITTFDFKEQLLSLLHDPLLVQNLSMLDVPQDNPFNKFIPPDGRLSCFNSRKWYQKAWNYCCQQTNDWMCPIIFGCDETLVGSHLGRKGITPLTFTLSIFSEELRNKSSSWRFLGFIYDLDIYGKRLVTTGPNNNQQKRYQTVEEKSAKFHKVLRQVLDSYIQVQQNGGILNHQLTLGTVTKIVNIKVPCGLILGDMQGGDKHCGSCVSYSYSLNRLCRQCNVSGRESGNPNIQCSRMSMTLIKQYVQNNELENLNLISQYNVHVAWFDVDFGGCKYGIFSAAMPVEALHLVEGGLIKDVLDILFAYDL